VGRVEEGVERGSVLEVQAWIQVGRLERAALARALHWQLVRFRVPLVQELLQAVVREQFRLVQQALATVQLVAPSLGQLVCGVACGLR